MRRRPAVSCLLLAGTVVIGACASLPQIPTSLIGCYGVEVMHLTNEHRLEAVDAPPPVIQIDTAFGGLTLAPVWWLEAGGIGRRGALVSVNRPQTRAIQNGRLVSLPPGRVTALPADSLTFTYGQGLQSLTGYLNRDSTGSWSGLGSTDTGLSPFVQMHLTPRECPAIPFGRPRG